MNKNDTAFPSPGYGDDKPSDGLTKREYFAAMAMQGMLGNQETYLSMQLKDVAAESVVVADELINALNKD